jgi:prolyl-tRNA editing enzyme YbaK/EbsC (Cys-tRNA(Pro) deacylase)
MFLDYLEKNELKFEIIEAKDSTHTAQEAADYCGCKLASIVKSLLLVNKDGFLLFLVPGDKRLEIDKLKVLYGNDLRMSTAEEVKSQTGYSIGGVPPFGHKNKIKTIVVDGFPETDKLYAAAGSSNAMFSISLPTLVKLVS